MLREVRNHVGALEESLFPRSELRFVNWYLQHGCDLDCFYCKVPKQRVGVMNRQDRMEVLNKVRKLCSKEPIISLLGGEPTLRPDFLVEAVRDSANAGFLVNVVSNGWGLTPELISRLGKAGLHYLGISVDCDEDSIKSNLGKALELHDVSKRYGIIPVINTVITRNTEGANFKKFANNIIDNGCFISPIACSPEVPDGVFSNASIESVPTHNQLKELATWLAWKKLSTGLVSASFSYLWALYNSGSMKDSQTRLWHCSPNFRYSWRERGRGYITVDSDGYVGSCQEFPRLVNLLNTPSEKISLRLLDKSISNQTQKCPGCLHNCYVMEEEIRGIKAMAEAPTFIQIANIKSSAP
jgi:MoaA/NifB/PqqE/SkfB family radical SAM enzyme